LAALGDSADVMFINSVNRKDKVHPLLAAHAEMLWTNGARCKFWSKMQIPAAFYRQSRQR